jgi:hypothetical protein
MLAPQRYEPRWLCSRCRFRHLHEELGAIATNATIATITSATLALAFHLEAVHGSQSIVLQSVHFT